MPSDVIEGLGSLSLAGYAVIAAIIASGLASIVVSLRVGARYAALEDDLRKNAGTDRPFFAHSVLSLILADARSPDEGGHGRRLDVIIEHRFRSELRGLLLGERFVRAASGLVIILGLVGTFYGLTLSIGKLNALVSGDSDASQVAEGMIRGLTDTLAGMSIAFSTSLFGIAVAIVLTLFGIFCNVTERRTDVMNAVEAQLQTFCDVGEASGENAPNTRRLQRVVDTFGASTAELAESVHHFQVALQGFATTTRDFREFNSHLKDNVQRMSLSFGDLSEALKAQRSAIDNGRR